MDAIVGITLANLALWLGAAMPGAIFLPALLTGEDRFAPAPEAPPADWCRRLVAGPAGTGNLPVDLALAHIDARLFGAGPGYTEADAALASALQADDALQDAGIAGALSRYDEALEHVCVLPASSAQLEPALVEMRGSVAVIRPGRGTVDLPAAATGVVVDLRGLPAAPGLRVALEAAVAPALASAAAWPPRLMREHQGLSDEVFSPTNVYTNAVALQDGAVITATGRSDLPLAIVTGPEMAPAAAELAGMLRLSDRAWLVGEGVRSEVAGSSWRPVGAAPGRGVAFRGADFVHLFRRVDPTHLPGVSARQDDPDDASTAGLKHRFRVTDSDLRRMRVTLTAPEVAGLDLDLYVVHDADGDGVFAHPGEGVGGSATSLADEVAEINGALPAGDYEVWVHGWSVPGGSVIVDLGVDLQSGYPWPDEIPADRGGADPLGVASALLGQPPRAREAGPTARAPMTRVDAFKVLQPATMSRGEARAALLVTHGVLRRFYPYFGVVGDRIDGRLAETLATVDGWTSFERPAARQLLQRYGEAIADGHQFVFDFDPPAAAGVIPVFLDEIGGLPVVRHSGSEVIRPGDAIVSLDGRPSGAWFQEEYERTSAASPGYRFDLASRRFRAIRGPATLVLRDPDGAERTVTVEPVSAEAVGNLMWATSRRVSGPLADLGAPELHYLNLDGSVTVGIQAVRDAIAGAAAGPAAGMVVDMRGYPSGLNHYEVAMRLIRRPFRSPRFVYPIYRGPDRFTWVPFQSDIDPIDDPAFDGPIALLTGPHAVSAAENFMLMLEDDPRVTVVGQPSAATNGNITGVSLPGAFGFTFTGMELLRPDGSVFHGVGIRPDVLVPRSAADFRDGIDRDLMTAIEVLRAGTPPSP